MPLFQNLDWDDWFYGLWVAIATGSSNAAVNGMGLNLLDSKDFNIYTAKFWSAIGMFLVFGGIKDFLLYINKRPAPARINKRVTDSVEVPGVGKIEHIVETSKPAPPVAPAGPPTEKKKE